MRGGWEFIAMLIIFAVLLQMVIEFIQPLVPYMVGVVLLALIAAGFYHKNRTW